MKTLISDSNHLSHNSSKNPDLHNWNDWAYKLGILLDDVITTDGLTNAQRLEIAIKDYANIKGDKTSVNDHAKPFINKTIEPIIKDGSEIDFDKFALRIANDLTLHTVKFESDLKEIQFKFQHLFELADKIGRKLDIKFDIAVLKHSNIFNVNGTTVKNLIELLKENIIK